MVGLPRAAGRRRYLRLLATGLATALAGCAGGDGEMTPMADDGSGTGSTPAGSDGGGGGTATEGPATPETTAPPTPAGELDLREANVVAVEVSGNGTLGFDVTLYHDDDGEEGYANWWQVEALDGTRLGRRTLTHAHGTREFTRSERIEVPEGVTCVVARGHDQVHGYGGRVMLVNLESGATRAVRQGSERRSFSKRDCP